MIQADARNLPFRSATFDMVFTSPPWDAPAVFDEALSELRRVLTRRGLLLVLLPHLDRPDMATLTVSDRAGSSRQSFMVDKPRTVNGDRYYSPADEWVAGVLAKYRPRRLLDPFCGTGTIPRVARSVGVQAVGCDLFAA